MQSSVAVLCKPRTSNNFSPCMQVDLVKKEGASAQQQMVRVAEQFNGLHSFEQTFWVSALRDQGMAKLKDFLRDRYKILSCSLAYCMTSPLCMFCIHNGTAWFPGQTETYVSTIMEVPLLLL